MTTERIKEIQLETAYTESQGVQQALFKVWNETQQASEQTIADLKEKNKNQQHAIVNWMNTKNADNKVIADLKAELSAKDSALGVDKVQMLGEVHRMMGEIANLKERLREAYEWVAEWVPLKDEAMSDVRKWLTEKEKP